MTINDLIEREDNKIQSAREALEEAEKSEPILDFLKSLSIAVKEAGGSGDIDVNTSLLDLAKGLGNNNVRFVYLPKN